MRTAGRTLVSVVKHKTSKQQVTHFLLPAIAAVSVEFDLEILGSKVLP
jgi:hypothetical protein